MIDVVNKQTRSRMMAAIRGKDTSPELIVRRFLHAKGYRFRLHRKDLPGTPDVVLPRYRIAIFVHGCFWHQHGNCAYAATPASRPEFWSSKLGGNVTRDHKNIEALLARGWRILVVWECGVRHQQARMADIERFISADVAIAEWPLQPPKPRNT